MDHPIFHSSPEFLEHVRLRQWGEALQANMRYYVYMDVLEELLFASMYHLQQPCVALLTGPLGIEQEGPFLEFTGFEGLFYLEPEDDARVVYEQLMGSFLETFGQESSMISAHGLSAVGFFMHDPGGAARLTDVMAKVHLSLFNVPYQTVLVADCVHDLLAIYGRAPNRPFFNASFKTVERLTAHGHTDEDAGLDDVST